MSDPGARYVPALRFSWLTRWYDVVARLTTRETTFKRALLRQAAIEDGHRVLDLGCGTGTLAIRIRQAHPGAAVVGIDGDPEILEIARRKAARARAEIRFRHARAESLPFPDSSFDRVVSSLFFHHLTPTGRRAAIAEAYRVMEPGGELHVADWGAPSSSLMRALSLPVRLLDGPDRTRENFEGRLPDLFREAGFGNVARTGALSTVVGTLARYRAVKPRGTGAGETGVHPHP